MSRLFKVWRDTISFRRCITSQGYAGEALNSLPGLLLLSLHLRRLGPQAPQSSVILFSSASFLAAPVSVTSKPARIDG